MHNIDFYIRIQHTYNQTINNFIIFGFESKNVLTSRKFTNSFK